MTGHSATVTDETRRMVDGKSLLDDLGIDRQEMEWRKSFVRLDETDKERMRALDSTFDEVAPEIVDEFYEHLTSNAAANEIFGRSSKRMDQLKADQQSYLRSLTDGEYGAEYFARRARIGKIHDMLDLGPKFYLGAYSIYYEGLLGAIGESVKAEFEEQEPAESLESPEEELSGTGGVFSGLVGGSRAPEEQPTLDRSNDVDAAVDAVVEQASSLLKVLALDQQVAMDTYVHAYSEAAREQAEHREQLAKEVEKDLRDPIDDVSEASEMVADNSATIREIADDQAADMEDVSAEISQMSATVEEIAATAEDVEATSDEAAERARTGEQAADEAIEVMEDVAKAAVEASADLEQLHEQINEVDEVIEAIDDIAEQTNLLALNASIEAARAGEAGEGFAVVADEVKQLAAESRQRASEVEETVGGVQKNAADTIESLSETTETLHEGIDRGEEAMDSLDEIVEAVERTTEGIAEVAVATDEQAVSAEEVTSMVETAREQAEDVAHRVDDVADASREQTDRMESIQATVDRLVAGDEGPGSGSSPRSSNRNLDTPDARNSRGPLAETDGGSNN
ncbi:MAG: globin-coupled sensor protein [Halobellus sp.]|uniref:globin-coupled sensor protein n=1 Tax=Halobellus sp. TaxID=1979212 RepID=UPI0035D46A84